MVFGFRSGHAEGISRRAGSQAANWGIWKREFKHLRFVPILDFIHALTYVFAAAMAGRSGLQGGPIYPGAPGLDHLGLAG